MDIEFSQVEESNKPVQSQTVTAHLIGMYGTSAWRLSKLSGDCSGTKLRSWGMH